MYPIYWIISNKIIYTDDTKGYVQYRLTQEPTALII